MFCVCVIDTATICTHAVGCSRPTARSPSKWSKTTSPNMAAMDRHAATGSLPQPFSRCSTAEW
ncbi:hypothetical protein ACFPRL_31905 [Pseudoclavibacter helvolus]